MADQIQVFMLDTLLDTRIATIAKLDPECATKIVSDPETHRKYLERPNDLFKEFGIDPDSFAKAYAERDITTLMRSTATNFLFELRNIGTAMVDLKAEQPHQVDDIRFIINTYPYKDLTSTEIDRILDAIGARLQASIILEHTYCSPRDLSPAMIKSAGYNAVYFYDFREWLEHHYHMDRVTESTVGIIPGTYIYTAPHFVDIEQLQAASEYQNPNGENASPLIGLQIMFAPYFRLELIRMEIFSMAHQQVVVNDAINQ